MDWVNWECQSRSGQWSVGPASVEVYDIEDRDIYQPSQEPGFVCWVILWQEADGTLKCGFTEASGDPALWPPSYNFNSPGIDYYTKTLVSHDGGETWTDTGWQEPQDPRWIRNPDHHWRRTVVMPDGSLLRLMPHTIEGLVEKSRTYVYDESLEGKEHDGLPKGFPFRKHDDVMTYAKRTAIWRSTDGGKSWNEIFCDPDSQFFGSGFLRCQDGHLVTVGTVYLPESHEGSEGVDICESLDGGESWSQPRRVIRAEGEFKEVKFTEENDVVELPDGRLLVVCRTSGQTDYGVQAYLTRTGPGEYEATDIKFTPMFHASNPILLQCSDGTIWFAGDGGSQFVTVDEGGSWQELPICETYYAQMVEVAPGRLLNITQYQIGDDAFPHRHDASIRQTSFSYRRADMIEQSNAEASLALSVIDVPPSKDTHLHASVRADGCSGLAFRIQPDAAEYYVYMLQIEPEEAGEVKPGQSVDAFHLLGKVSGGQMTTLRRRYIGEIELGEWLQMQVRTQGELLQVALAQEGQNHRARKRAFYLSMREQSLSQGGIGLVTVSSTGAFKSLEVAPSSQLIRDTWWQ